MSLESCIQVRLMSATSLRAVNVGKGASDPYAVVTLARTRETQTTVVCLNTIDPKWYHNLVFRAARPDDVLHIRIYDKNLLAGDRDLGSLSVTVADALSTANAHLSEAAFHPPKPPQNFSAHSPPSSDNNFQYETQPHGPHQHTSQPPPHPPLSYRLHQHHEQHSHEHHFPHIPPLRMPRPQRYQNGQSQPPHEAPSSDPFAPSAPPITPPPEEGPSLYSFQSSVPVSASAPAPAPTEPSLYPYVPTPPPHAPSASNPLPAPPRESQPLQGPALSHTPLRSHGDLQRASGSFQAGLKQADVHMQRRMTCAYSVIPQGRLNLIIAPGSIADLAMTAPRNHYKRFQTHKFSEQLGNIGKLPLQNRLGHSVGHVLKKGVEMAGPLQAARDLFQPVQAAFQEHSTWKVDMRAVDAVFRGKRHGWNRDYPAAQKIFEGKRSLVARTAVQMQHSYLYGGATGIKPLVDIRKDLLEVTGNLLDAKDFMEMMEYGVRRGKARLFTYVLMPERLYIAETGAKFFRDMMSKHAMHSSASQQVVYAGELHFRRVAGAGEAETRLIIDNNSGTYSPSKVDLPLVEEVFRRNFAGLHVEGLDYKDPRLEQYRRDLPSCSSESGFVGVNP